jgi:hypothetical protein
MMRIAMPFQMVVGGVLLLALLAAADEGAPPQMRMAAATGCSRAAGALPSCPREKNAGSEKFLEPP